MLLALDNKGQPVRATPNERAICPECQQPVIAKCGEIIIWHWAHIALNPNCANQGETEWHLKWKLWALDRGCQIEQKVMAGFRADVVTSNGTVIELQTQPLAPEIARAREAAYGRQLCWLIEINTERAERINWSGTLDSGAEGFWYTRGPKSLARLRAPVYLDIAGRGIWLTRFKLIQKEDPEYGAYESLFCWGYRVEPETLFLTVRSARVEELLRIFREAERKNEHWYTWIRDGRPPLTEQEYAALTTKKPRR